MDFLVSGKTKSDKKYSGCLRMVPGLPLEHPQIFTQTSVRTLFHKRRIPRVWVKIGRVKGVPGAPQGPYEDIVTNFHWIWSYKTSETQYVNLFRNF
jgi:hypothetical protein